MPPLVIQGNVKLELGIGFEANDQVYDLTQGLHCLYESQGCSLLRIAKAADLAETQVDTVIASIDFKHHVDENHVSSEPTIFVTLRAGPSIEIRVVTTDRTRHGVRISGEAVEIVGPSENFPVRDRQMVVLQLEGYAPNFPTFVTNFDELRIHESTTVIPSSDLQKDIADATHRPLSPLAKTISFVKETPTASRYVDKLADDGEIELKAANSPRAEIAAGRDEKMGTESPVNDSRTAVFPKVSARETRLHSSPALVAPEARKKPVKATKKKAASYKKGRTIIANDSPEPSTVSHAEAIDGQYHGGTQQSATVRLSDEKIRGAGRQKRKAHAAPDDEPETIQSHSRKKVRQKAAIEASDEEANTTEVNGEDELDLDDLHGASTLLQASTSDPEGLLNAATTPSKHADEPRVVSSDKKGRGRPRKPAVVHSEALEGRIPSSSVASPRRSQRSERKQLVVAFSNSTYTQQSVVKKFMQNHLKIVDNLDDSTDILCVGDGKLVTTSKLLKAVLLGKPIVTDDWIKDSVTKQELSTYEDYYMSERDSKKQWDFKEGWSKGEAQSSRQKFDHLTLFITPALHKAYGSSGFSSIKELGRLVGFKNVTSYPAASFKEKPDKVVALGAEVKDTDAKILQDQNVAVYHKDALTAIIFSGSLPSGRKFLLERAKPAAKDKAKKKKG